MMAIADEAYEYMDIESVLYNEDTLFCVIAYVYRGDCRND